MASPIPLERLPLPAYEADREGRLVGCNGALRTLLGIPPGEDVGRDWARLLGVDGTCRGAGVESCIRAADGTWRTVAVHLSALEDGGCLGVVTDVTETRVAERRLAESEIRLARLANFSREGLLLHTQGEIIDANRSLCRMVGWRRAELLGRPWADLVAPDDVEEVRRYISQRSSHSYRIRLRRKDGSLLPAEVAGRDVGDGVRVVSLRDISQDVEAERALLEREMLYRQMFETNRAVKLLIDPESGEIIDANHAAELFYGWPLDVLRSMRITDINILPPDEVRAEMARARDESRLYFRFPHKVASGEIRSVEVYSGPVLHHGRVLLHSIIHDVTDRERYQRELERKTAALEQSNADLEQFAYVASHDLQEPLRIVVSYLQLLERRYRGRMDAEADEFIGFAVDGAKRMSRLINDLLAYSRVETQGRTLRPVDLGAVLAVVRDNLRLTAEACGAAIESGPLPVVTGDESQLVSLLQNLIGNAIKYRVPDRPPVVRVSAERAEAEWVVRVDDNGLGIDPEYHERIFMIFQRLHTHARYEGTGIGLALAKRIVTRHGGRIWVESREGEGAAFLFTLPTAG